MELAPYLCYQLDFLLDFLLKISLISIYKMPPCLLSNLLKALSNLSLNIRKIGNSPYWLPGRHVQKLPLCMHVTSLLVDLSHAHKGQKWPYRPVWRIWQKFEYCDPNISALLSDNKPNEVASFSH